MVKLYLELFVGEANGRPVRVITRLTPKIAELYGIKVISSTTRDLPPSGSGITKIPAKLIVNGREHPAHLEISEGRQCYNCGATTSPTWHSPHQIAMNHGYHYCQECWYRLYPKGNRSCGLRKDRTRKN